MRRRQGHPGGAVVELGEVPHATAGRWWAFEYSTNLCRHAPPQGTGIGRVSTEGPGPWRSHERLKNEGSAKNPYVWVVETARLETQRQLRSRPSPDVELVHRSSTVQYGVEFPYFGTVGRSMCPVHDRVQTARDLLHACSKSLDAGP